MNLSVTANQNFVTVNLKENIPKPFIQTYKSVTTILKLKPKVRFTCAHCHTVFETTEWHRTKGNHYSASCPCCPYQAWAK